MSWLVYPADSVEQAAEFWRDQSPEEVLRGSLVNLSRGDDWPHRAEEIVVDWSAPWRGSQGKALCAASPANDVATCYGVVVWVQVCNWTIDLTLAFRPRSIGDPSIAEGIEVYVQAAAKALGCDL